MSPRPLRLARALPLLLLVLAAAGCGSGTGPGAAPGSGAKSATGSPSGTPAPSPSSSPSSSPLHPGVPTSPGSARPQVVTGVVSDGVEARCLILTPESFGAGGIWVLVGHTAGLAAGQRVTLRGRQMLGLATTCQQGRPFQVDEVVSTSG